MLTKTTQKDYLLSVSPLQRLFKIMSDRQFQLQPFSSTQAPANLDLKARISQDQQQLKINYQLHGDLAQLLLPTPTEQPHRKNDLWQTTCFEFFLAVFNAPEYWEFNLAPTGDWNAYRFRHYRRNMCEAANFKSLPLRILNRDSSSYEIQTEIELQSIISGNISLEISLTTVIADQNQNLSYWAINHPDSEPNFHRRDGFILLN